MTLPELMLTLTALGVRLSPRLSPRPVVEVDAPPGVLTEELLSAIAAHKPSLLNQLGRKALWAEPSPVEVIWSRWRVRVAELRSAGRPTPEAERLAFQELLPEMKAVDEAHWQCQLEADPVLAHAYARASRTGDPPDMAVNGESGPHNTGQRPSRPSQRSRRGTGGSENGDGRGGATVT
jgi:hypothetical protein